MLAAAMRQAWFSRMVIRQLRLLADQEGAIFGDFSCSPKTALTRLSDTVQDRRRSPGAQISLTRVYTP